MGSRCFGWMQSIRGESGGVGACGSAMGGDIEKGGAFAAGDGLCDGVEGIDLVGDPGAVPVGGKGGDAPVRDLEHDDMIGRAGEPLRQL